MKELPKKYRHSEIEASWKQFWQENDIYRWDSSASRKESFVVDTPPPTVSGSLHVGHVFSYTHTDLIVRFQRMRGKAIMYPMGWDDNGLPTERRVQNKFGITCNPHKAYEENWAPPEKAPKKQADFQEVSRRNFIEACNLVTEEDELAFEELWRNLGLSVEWSQQYATIDEHCRAASQRSFLDLVEKNLVYSTESPTMWDVTYQTALAQADIEDRERPGAYHDISFSVVGGENFVISTTRPELLVSCIAVVAHPDDHRYKALFGTHARTPLFSAEVPILPSTHADPEKGSGIMMICTFGDAADVDWWKASGLPIKQALGKNGRFESVSFTEGAFESKAPEQAQKYYQELVGKTTAQARKIIAELLAQDGTGPGAQGAALQGEPRAIQHPVKFYEKGEQPVEFVSTRQWFVKILEQKQALLAQGEKIAWHPDYMKTRYSNWVEGLNYDWCISRQRFFGVPFPVWYPIDSEGRTEYDKPIFADTSSLPIDPLSEAPEGYSESQRDQAGGFRGDPDVMDTWATSSLTPQIVSHWGKDEERHQKLFPMNMRPQSHEIIRTWAFYTIAKAWMHEQEIPWENVVISGWILDPDRKKMSKSKGNVVTPQHLLEQYSSDGVRYWAARARLGVDTAYDESVFKNGQKLTTKLFNASKFVLLQIKQFQDDGHSFTKSDITQPLDRALLETLRETIGRATSSFEEFDYAQALSISESAFWNFCDTYLELVKVRAYQGDPQGGRASAIATLESALSIFVRLFAPFMPYVTEEIWSWHFAESQSEQKVKSIHLAQWPSSEEIAEVPAPEHSSTFPLAAEVLSKIHHAKSTAQKSLKWGITRLEVKGAEQDLQALSASLSDVIQAGRIESDKAITLTESSLEGGEKLHVEVELSENAPS